MSHLAPGNMRHAGRQEKADSPRTRPTIQQSGSAAPMGKLEIGLHDSTFEREADLVGAAVSAGDTVTVSSALPSVAAQIQRDGYGEVRRAEARAALRDRLKLDYKKAEKSNKTYAKTGPAWEASCRPWQVELQGVARPVERRQLQWLCRQGGVLPDRPWLAGEEHRWRDWTRNLGTHRRT